MATYRIEAEVIAISMEEARAAFLKRAPLAHISKCELQGGATGQWVFTITGYLPEGAKVQSVEEARTERGCGILALLLIAFIVANCGAFWMWLL